MAKPEFTNQLLKEAIADAEIMRQTAIENAKLSLEETFTPQIKSMLERKLRAEAEGMGDDMEMEEATELPHEQGEAEGSTEMPADSSDIGAGENKEPSDDAFASAEDDMSGEGHTDSSTDWYDDWSEKDFDLDEVIKELEEDVKLMEEAEEEAEDDEADEQGEKEKEKEDESEDEEESDAEGEEDEEEGEYPEGEPAGVEGEEPPADSSHIGQKGAAKFTLEEFIGMMQEAGYDMGEMDEMGFDHTLPANEPPMEEGDLSELSPDVLQGASTRRNIQADKSRGAGAQISNATARVHKDLDGQAKKLQQHAATKPSVEESDLNLEEILAMLEAEDASIQETQASEEMASEVTKLHEELAEYRQAINLLRGKLNEVNLLNAKLLFTNKIFRKEGLSNEQKVTIVENFDRATTVREVKMVYAVLAETLTAETKSKAAKLPRKVVAEGLASKATPSTAPKADTSEIITENSVTKRLQQLAGIIS